MVDGSNVESTGVDVKSVIGRCIDCLSADMNDTMREGMAENLLSRAFFLCNATGYHRGYVDGINHGR